MIIGSRTIVTDVGGAMRGWLVFLIESRLPSVLSLSDRPYGGEVTEQQAHSEMNADARRLHASIVSLDREQLDALAQQDDDGHSGQELVERVLRYWDRPRLDGVDWLRTGPGASRRRSRSSCRTTKESYGVGEDAMLAGDGFADVHATVLEDRPDDWIVQVHWHTWDR